MYAPVALNQFWGHEVDFWLLGHIHVPRQFSDAGECRALYPGSPYAMDPGESGAHGVWLLSLEPNQPPALEHIPISPVRYETVNIDLGDVSDEDGFLRNVTDALRQIGRNAATGHSPRKLREISCRIRYTGATVVHKSVRRWAENAQQDLTIDSSEVSIVIDSWSADVHPPVDLLTLAEGNDPVAETAKLILGLSIAEPDQVYVDLVRHTEIELSRVTNHASYAALPHAEPPENQARDLLIDQAWKLLSALRAQKEIA
jgi:DNA repair exonuclease SbcCD nuclease subunit